MEVRIGLELECAIRHHCDLNIGSYHNGIRFINGWKAERDGSLSAPDNFTAVEFVSDVCHPNAMKNNLVRLFEELWGEEDDDFSWDEDMSDYMQINNSMGAHIHMSVGNYQSRRRWQSWVVPYQYCVKIREEYENRLRGFNPDIFFAYKQQYFRGYARRVESTQEYNSYITYYERFREWNKTSNTGLEWRSFNLMGCNSLNDIIACVDMAAKVINDVLSEAHQNNYAFQLDEINIDVDDADIYDGDFIWNLIPYEILNMAIEIEGACLTHNVKVPTMRNRYDRNRRFDIPDCQNETIATAIDVGEPEPDRHYRVINNL